MYDSVKCSSLKCCDRYSLYIFAFAFAFYIMLHKDDGREERPDDEYVFFNDLGLTTVKTFTMFVGELEFSDLPIETPVGYMFLLTFIFLIVVVLMNLLNGLAVSDTSLIRNEAEIHCAASQVKIIFDMESTLINMVKPRSFRKWAKLPHALIRRFLGNVVHGIFFFNKEREESLLWFYPNLKSDSCFGLLSKTKVKIVVGRGPENASWATWLGEKPDMKRLFRHQDGDKARAMMDAIKKGQLKAMDIPSSIAESVQNIFVERTRKSA